MVLAAKKLKRPAVLDAKITKLDHLCERTKKEVLAAKVVGNEVPFLDFLRYRYIVDADGQCCAWKSLFLKMASGSTVLKIHSPFYQWYHHRIIPWKHFIPVRDDFADILDIYDWLKDHDEQAQDIAQSAQKLIESVTLESALNEMALFCHQLLECQIDRA
jgi:hypothetical protein